MGQGTEAAQAKRRKLLAHLIDVSEAEAYYRSLKGRLAIIARLKAAKAAEVQRGRNSSWLYDVNRHLNLCFALRTECEALPFLPIAGSKAPRKGDAECQSE